MLAHTLRRTSLISCGHSVVNGHTVDLISSYGGSSIVTVVEDAHGSTTTIAGQVYTVATGDISTVVCVLLSFVTIISINILTSTT